MPSYPPDNSHDGRVRPSVDSLAPHHPGQPQDRSQREGDAPSDRGQSRSRGNRRPSASKICGKCGGHLTGQFVRALGDTYHLECFTCHDCDKIVASKFFPVPDQGPNQFPLCETDYFRRLDLLCHACGGALRGSYITALERKYHIEHFTCSVCPTVFGASDSYYEHEGNVYCHYHYSTKFAQRCNGCQTAILKQFVEIFRNGQNQHWHPECYMIHKYWNVKLHSSGQTVERPSTDHGDAPEEVREGIRKDEEKMEEKVLWIWRTLSQFEEKSATCISDMLLHVSNGAYMEGVMAAKKFIMHVDLLFTAADDLDRVFRRHFPKGLGYNRESKLLCKKVVAFFTLLSQSQDSGMRRLGVTQELLSLVTGLAHYLKLLIRICLQGTLKLERETGSSLGLANFLNHVNSLDEKLGEESYAETFADASAYIPKSADTCPVCDKPVEDKCYKTKDRNFHIGCMSCQQCNADLIEGAAGARWSESMYRLLCSNCAASVPDAQAGFEACSRLKQYVHLLRVAHARLLATLRTSGALPHTSDDPNLADYDSRVGHRLSGVGEEGDAPYLKSDLRSRSYSGSSPAGGPPSSYEQTLGDIRRLRSTRLDKHLSNSMKRARTSQIIGGPEASSVRPGSSGEGAQQTSQGMQIVQDPNVESATDLTFNANTIALDDIPRIVAAEQAKDQRPNASRYARGHLISQDPKPKLVNGHRRDFSGGQELDRAIDMPQPRARKFFSELGTLDYFIVRHLAVLSMQPLLDGQWNQEELLELIEMKRPTFWGKFGKAFKNDKSKGNKKKGVFGRSLDQVLEKDGAESTDGVGPGILKIPAVVQEAISAMRMMDMSVEGVFRKNGNLKRLNQTVESIDTKGCDSVDLSKENPVQVANLLKRFLRDLPDPVLTFKLFPLFIAGARIPDEEKSRRVLHLACCLMPNSHRDTMEVLFAFLNWVSSFHTVDDEVGSKMDIHNLATVIAPNILYANPKGQEQKMADVDTSFLAIESIRILIEYNDTMCEVPEDILSLLNDPTLFDEDRTDLTTKEILKRYGQIYKSQPQMSVADPTTPGRARDGRSNAPVITRVDTDPDAWNSETSVRPMPGGSGYATPPQNHYEYPPPNLPYAHSQGSRSNDSRNNSPNRHSQYRSPMAPKQGAMGVTGAG